MKCLLCSVFKYQYLVLIKLLLLLSIVIIILVQNIFASLQDLTDDNEEVDADPVHMTDVTSVLGL